MSEYQSRITQLDGLRACAIAAVFIHHAYHVKLLWMGVDLFFVLSGFLITGILVNQKTKRFPEFIGSFYVRRSKRILPPYLILLGWVALTFHGRWLHYWYLYIGGMNFIFPLRIPCPDFLSSLWSLAVEEQFYLIWPVAVFLLNRKQLIRVATAMVVLAPLLRFACTPFFRTPWAIYMLLPFRMDTLASGALTALLWPRLLERLSKSVTLRKRVGQGCAAAFLAGVMTILVLRRYGVTTYGSTRFGNLFLYEATLAMMASAFVLILVGYGQKLLSAWPLVLLGRISYSFYLVHLVALHFWPHQALAALAASIGYSLASWLAIEKPILSLRSSMGTFSGKPVNSKDSLL